MPEVGTSSSAQGPEPSPEVRPAPQEGLEPDEEEQQLRPRRRLWRPRLVGEPEQAECSRPSELVPPTIRVVTFRESQALERGELGMTPMDGTEPPSSQHAQRRRVKSLAVPRRKLSPTAAFGIERVLDKLLIPTWKMEGRTEIIPQTWDADTPQVPTDAA
jgi:hypothetical protein